MLKRILSAGFQTWKILSQYYFGVKKYKTLVFQLHSSANSNTIELLIPNYHKQLIKSWYFCQSNKKLPERQVIPIRNQIIWVKDYIKYKGYQPGLQME